MARWVVFCQRSIADRARKAGIPPLKSEKIAADTERYYEVLQAWQGSQLGAESDCRAMGQKASFRSIRSSHDIVLRGKHAPAKDVAVLAVMAENGRSALDELQRKADLARNLACGDDPSA